MNKKNRGLHPHPSNNRRQNSAPTRARLSAAVPPPQPRRYGGTAQNPQSADGAGRPFWRRPLWLAARGHDAPRRPVAHRLADVPLQPVARQPRR